MGDIAFDMGTRRNVDLGGADRTNDAAPDEDNLSQNSTLDFTIAIDKTGLGLNCAHDQPINMDFPGRDQIAVKFGVAGYI